MTGEEVKPLKILMYEPLLTPASMGNRIHAQELAENLTRMGSEVILVSQLSQWPYETGVVPKRVERLMNLPKAGAIAVLIYTFFSAMLKRVPRQDIVYTRGAPLASGLILAKLLRCPLVVEVNGLRRDELNASWKGRPPLLNRLYLWLYEREIVWGSHVVAVTPGIKRTLEAELGISSNKVTVVPNGANTELFKPMDVHRARAELKMPDNYRFICFVGHLAPWQGVEYLIQCAPLILEECPEARIIIVGDGPMRAELLTLAKELGVLKETIFTGSVPYEKVPLYINASDVCVVPKRVMKSGYSTLKLFEYMAVGIPVIATRTEGFEMLEKYNAGLLVNPENSAQFAGAVVKLLQDHELRKQMGENGRKYVVEKHSWQSVAGKVAQVCERAISA
jgi:glycosyltransferase involved in cell wall biosynthesis